MSEGSYLDHSGSNLHVIVDGGGITLLVPFRYRSRFCVYLITGSVNAVQNISFSDIPHSSICLIFSFLSQHPQRHNFCSSDSLLIIIIVCCIFQVIVKVLFL